MPNKEFTEYVSEKQELTTREDNAVIHVVVNGEPRKSKIATVAKTAIETLRGTVPSAGDTLAKIWAALLQVSGGGGVPVDTTYENTAYGPTVEITYNEGRPNKKITQTGNIVLVINGAQEGKGGIVRLTRNGNFSVTVNGEIALLPTYNASKPETVKLFFTYTGEENGGVQWFYNQPKPYINPADIAGAPTEDISFASVNEIQGIPNDGNGIFGYEFTVFDDPITATHLTRYMQDAIDAKFPTRIYNATDFSIIASGIVDGAGVAPGEEASVEIAPVQLAANATYLIMGEGKPGQIMMYGTAVVASGAGKINRGAKAVTGSGYDPATGIITKIDDYYPGQEGSLLGSASFKFDY